ncbi:MAG: hypothetical protein ABIJ28_01015 [Patescibacteria group bacterium]
MKRHEIFDLAVKKSNDFKRQISYFRHPQTTLIHLFAYPEALKESWLCLGVHSGGHLFYNPHLKYFLQEDYYIYPKSERIKIYVRCDIKSATNETIHDFMKEKYFTGKDISEYDWLRNQLNVIAGWLKDKRLVRVDPYNPDKVLEGEETKEDKKMENMISRINKWKYALENCEIKPGIINPEQDYKGRN